MNPLLESLARRGVDCTKGMKMEAPPLPEPFVKGVGQYESVYAASQMLERDAYWLAKVEEAAAILQESVDAFAMLRAHNVFVWPNHPKSPERRARDWLAANRATSIREGG